MKTDVLAAIREEKNRIEAEIDSLSEEIKALDIVLNRNPTEKTPMRRTKGPSTDEQGVSYTKSEQRVIDALYAIGKSGTAKEIFDYLCGKFPNENRKKLHSSVRQFASSLGRSGRITVKRRDGNLGSVYGIK